MNKLVATPIPGKELLDPSNHILIMIDHQSQMAFATKSIDMTNLRNNVALVAEASKIFNVPTILTTVAEKSFSGPIFEEITDAYPKADIIDRTTMNAWEDKNITDAVNKAGKGRIVFAGLWTSVCIVEPALSALDQGFDVYVIADASGDITDEAHELSMQRMIQLGVKPLTSLQYLLELQRDWARTETYDAVTGLARSKGGAYGLGITYAKTMFNASEGRHSQAA